RQTTNGSANTNSRNHLDESAWELMQKLT
ncbi:MAG: hypothetical protein ACI9S9_004617, partial [Planctomycetota bacterium]